MVILSRADIEAIGERVFRAYKKLPEFENKRVYNISPEILIENLLKLRIEYCHLSLDRTVLGVTTPIKDTEVRIYNTADEEEKYTLDGKTLLVEQDLRDDAALKGRFHLTQIHEACHIILEWLYPGKYIGEKNRLCYCRANDKPTVKNWEEWQVDTLASVILMPADIVKQALFFFGFDDRIPMINRVYAKKDYQQFSMIAVFLGVSKQALSIRLSQLGLVGRNDFDDPYAVMDIFND